MKARAAMRSIAGNRTSAGLRAFRWRWWAPWPAERGRLLFDPIGIEMEAVPLIGPQDVLGQPALQEGQRFQAKLTRLAAFEASLQIHQPLGQQCVFGLVRGTTDIAGLVKHPLFTR